MAARLCDDERVQIEVGVARGESDEQIAARLGRHRSTIWREITAGVGAGGRRDRYRARAARAAAQRRAARPKASKLARCAELASAVAAKLKARWSPHAIAAWLKATGAALGCCAETIYRAAYANHASSGLAAGSWKLLPANRRRRRPRQRAEQARRNQLGDIRPIACRPLGAGDRTEAGHWEGDLIMGSSNRSAVVTLIERVSRFTLLADLPEGHHSDAVLAALVDAFAAVPNRLRRTLTWDQGREMTCWPLVEDGTGLTVYFADPHSPWQRPSNEQNNRCLRRWLPRSADLGAVPQSHLHQIAHNLNTMPRRLHHWHTAADRYAALCRDHR